MVERGQGGGLRGPGTPIFFCAEGLAAGRGCRFRGVYVRHRCAGDRAWRVRRCGGCGGAHGAAGAVAGCAAAGHRRGGEADRRGIVADRAGRCCRGGLAGAARWAALCLVRRGGVAGGGDVARAADAQRRSPVRLRHGHARDRGWRRETGAAGRDAGEPLAVARQLEPRDGEPLFRVGRKTVRRAAQFRAVVAGALSGAARPLAQRAVQLSRRRRRRSADGAAARLRRPRLFPARLFRLQDGTAVRLFELLARRRRPPAALRRVDQRRECGSGGRRARSGVRTLSARRRRRRAVRLGARARRPTKTPISIPCR